MLKQLLTLHIDEFLAEHSGQFEFWMPKQPLLVCIELACNTQVVFLGFDAP